MGDVHDALASALGDHLAVVFRDRRLSWHDVGERSRRLADVLHREGLGCHVEREHLQGWESGQDHLGIYLHNGNEYLESMLGAFKARVAPFNVNYRYVAAELRYLLNDAGARAIVVHSAFAPTLAEVRHEVPTLQLIIQVPDDSGNALLPGARWYDDVLADGDPSGPDVTRSPDDLYILYTGGTTGMPKGVMWRQDDLVLTLDSASKQPLPDVPNWEVFDERFAKPGPRNLPAAPLMHGTGAFNAMWNLVLGGSIVTLTGRHFDPVELMDTVEANRVNSVSIVGDAFAKPILRALDAEPTRWDITSLRVIFSSGVIWAAETKAGLLRHNQRLIMVDALGSSEAIGMANSTVTAESSSTTASFRAAPGTKVLTEDGREVAPGSGERGRVALRGRMPVGYYKDAAKTEGTFVMHDGVRWSIPGDWAEVAADGTLKLFGRGSQCINTGGEKVYPEEVEEAMKLHTGVADAAVVGVPDERFGEAITALVEPDAGAVIDPAALIAHVRTTLAAFKAPKHVLVTDTIGRAANGKLDYKRLRTEALQRLGLPEA